MYSNKEGDLVQSSPYFQVSLPLFLMKIKTKIRARKPKNPSMGSLHSTRGFGDKLIKLMMRLEYDEMVDPVYLLVFYNASY